MEYRHLDPLPLEATSRKKPTAPVHGRDWVPGHHERPLVFSADHHRRKLLDNMPVGETVALLVVIEACWTTLERVVTADSTRRNPKLHLEFGHAPCEDALYHLRCKFNRKKGQEVSKQGVLER
jgi:hypothetical protein